MLKIPDITKVHSDSGVWVPKRELVPPSITVIRDRVDSITKAQSSAIVTKTGTAVDAPGTVKRLLNITAVESPVKVQGRTVSQVSVSFTRNLSDTSFVGVRIWFKGYKGDQNLALMTQGTTSPITFLCESTGEQVTVVGQAMSASAASPIDFSPITTVLLDGVVSAPPAPTVSQYLTATPTGFQFAFNQLGSLGADVIDGYRLYRGTTSDPSASTQFDYVKHNPANTGAVVIQDAQPNGTTMYYWVSAVNTNQLESSKADCQLSTISSGSPFDSDSTITASTFLNPQGSIIPNQPIVVSYSYTDTSVSLSWGSQSVLRSDGSTFTVNAGSKAYTSLSSSTTYYIYAYIRLSDGTIQFTNPDPPQTTPSAVYATQCSLDGRSPVDLFKVTTAAPAAPGGGGTGGGGDICPEWDELVPVEGKGLVKAGEIQIGDRVLGRCFATGADEYRTVVAKSDEPCAAWRIIDGHRVSPCEAVWWDGAWTPAYKVPEATFDTFNGYKVKLTVESDSYDESNFYLGDGATRLLIHNVNMPVNPC